MTQFILTSDPQNAFAETEQNATYKSKWGGMKVTFRCDPNADTWNIQANSDKALGYANDLIEAFCQAIANNPHSERNAILAFSTVDI